MGHEHSPFEFCGFQKIRQRGTMIEMKVGDEYQVNILWVIRVIIKEWQAHHAAQPRMYTAVHLKDPAHKHNTRRNDG